MSAEKRKRGRGRTIILAIIVLLVACGVLSFFVSLFSDPDAPAAENTSAATEVSEEVVPEPTDELEATDEPAPTNPPEPTATARPTDTPMPTATAEPPPDPILLTGTGDSIVDIEKWPGPAVVHIIGNAGGSYFGVEAFGADGNTIDLLVNTTEPYDGVRPLDFIDGQQTARFGVTASGDWQIEVLSLIDTATPLNVPGSVAGTGDAVLLLSDQADVATITGNAAGSYFGVTSYGGFSPDLLVNTTEPYDGQVQIAPGALVLAITAVGDWTVDVTAR